MTDDETFKMELFRRLSIMEEKVDKLCNIAVELKVHAEDRNQLIEGIAKDLRDIKDEQTEGDWWKSGDEPPFGDD